MNLADAISAHEYSLRQSSGRSGILDLGRIEAAIARPYDGYHRYIHQKAAALLDAVAANHGFADGNKRTALVLFYLLLERSGFEFVSTSTIPNEDDIEHLIIDLTTHFLSYEECAQWLKARIQRTN